MMLLSVSDVLITLDGGDGMERPYEFSARTMNIYDVAGFKSLICKQSEEEIRKKSICENNKSSWGRATWDMKINAGFSVQNKFF